MRRFLALFSTLLFNLFRDVGTIAFSVVLPVLFLFVFGFLHAPQSDQVYLPVLAYYLNPDSEGVHNMERALESMVEMLEIKALDTKQEVEEAIIDGSAAFGLIFFHPKLELVFDPSRIQNNSYYQQLGKNILDEYNRLNANTLEIITIQEEKVAAREGLSNLDYLIPGIISLGILSSCLFGFSTTLLHFKERGVLKRLAATPLNKSLFIFTLMLTRFIIIAISTGIILLIVKFVFRLDPLINWSLFLPYIFIATLAMMSLGMLISLFAHSAKNAGEIGGILFTLMSFFSGVYYPIEFLPSYFRFISKILPLTYVIEGLHYVMNTVSLSPLRFNLIILGLLIGSGIVLLLTAWRFKWEES